VAAAENFGFHDRGRWVGSFGDGLIGVFLLRAGEIGIGGKRNTGLIRSGATRPSESLGRGLEAGRQRRKTHMVPSAHGQRTGTIHALLQARNFQGRRDIAPIPAGQEKAPLGIVHLDNKLSVATELTGPGQNAGRGATCHAVQDISEKVRCAANP
jgi:hypothetical protein